MKKKTCFSLAILTCLCTVVLAAKGQEPAPKIGIERSYDATKNETSVKLSLIKIFENDNETLLLDATGTFAGQTPASNTPAEVLVVLLAAARVRRYATEPQLVVTADGEVIRTRQMKNYGSRREGDKIIEPLLTMMPYDILVKLANAKKASLKIGETEYPLTAASLEALKVFAAELVPQGKN